MKLQRILRELAFSTLQNSACLRHLLMCHTALSFFPYCLEMFSYALTAPSSGSVSSKVTDRAPKQMVCSSCSYGPTPSNTEGLTWSKPEETCVNTLYIYSAHAQTHCTFPIWWLSNFRTRWESLPLSATITIQDFCQVLPIKTLTSHTRCEPSSPLQWVTSFHSD